MVSSRREGRLDQRMRVGSHAMYEASGPRKTRRWGEGVSLETTFSRREGMEGPQARLWVDDESLKERSQDVGVGPREAQ